MTIKIKGIKGFKGFKFITQIFVVKEREIEIGYPTDVKHVAHIGWDGVSGSPPSWMNQFHPGPDFNTMFNANQRDSDSTANPWSSQDCDMPIGGESPLSADASNTTKKKQRRKKKISSPTSNSSVSSRTSSKSKYTKKEPKSGF